MVRANDLQPAAAAQRVELSNPLQNGRFINRHVDAPNSRRSGERGDRVSEHRPTADPYKAFVRYVICRCERIERAIPLACEHQRGRELTCHRQAANPSLPARIPWRRRLCATIASIRVSWSIPSVTADREIVFLDQRLQERFTSMKLTAPLFAS